MNLGCTKNTDPCGRTAVNGPGGREFNPPNGSFFGGGATDPNHPNFCRWEGQITAESCVRQGCRDIEPDACAAFTGEATVEADIRLNKDNGQCQLEYGDVSTVYSFSGRSLQISKKGSKKK